MEYFPLMVLNKMKQYKVTLNLSVNIHHVDERYEETSPEKAEAFARTDAIYRLTKIEDYIKTFDPLEMVEYVLSEGEVKSAEWDKEKFQIHMVVETELRAGEVLGDLRMSSLEDGEYESCGETAWILFTRMPDGRPYDGDWNVKNFWEYALTDYRSNPISVEEVSS